MSSETDVVNRALSEIGARITIVSLSEDTSTAGVNARLHYYPIRDQLIRCAPWGFARKTMVASQIGNLVDGSSPYPWQYMYAYPPDCLKMRYVLPPPPDPPPATMQPGTVQIVPWSGPRRDWRYVVADDDSTGVDRKVILSNVPNAILVYNKRVWNVQLWDPEFEDAAVMALSNKLVVPLSGNINMKKTWAQLCEVAIAKAKVSDGNETIATTEHEPDWITARGLYSRVVPNMFNMGLWQPVWDHMNWGA